MAFILEQGFNVKRGHEEAFQEWTRKNDEATKASAPAGVEYLGTYIVAMTSEKEAGEYRVLWRLDSYATLDTLEESTRDAESDWGRLNREFTEFGDFPIGGQGSFSLLRPLADAVIWDIS